jgi:hypothetical protein
MPEAPDDDVQRQIVEKRVTVGLQPRPAQAMDDLVARTGLSKTEIVNKAITLYSFVESVQSAGHDLLVRRQPSGEIEIIRFL